MLTEGHKQRLQELAGIKKNILNESLPPYQEYFGFYDMANGLTPLLLKLLEENDIKHSYDSYRNYIEIEIVNPKLLIPLFEEADMIDVKIPLSDEVEYYYPPNEPGDCVAVRAPKVNIPKGAMM